LIARPFDFMAKDDVLHSQAYGCWLYIQLGGRAWYFGSLMPFGVRFELRPERSWLPRIRWVKHDRGCTRIG
jgi:hypothetical protein